MPAIEPTTDLVQKVYSTTRTRLDVVRRRLGRPITLTEKILFGHLADPDDTQLDAGRAYIDLQPDRCCIRAVIRDNEGRIRATGHASEDRTSSMINKTSYVENCETSAWGRALACIGIGIETSIASSNEVQMAIAQQNLGDLTDSLGLVPDLEGLTLDTLRADYFNLVDRMPDSEQPKLRGVYGFTAEKYRKGIAYMQSKLEGGAK